MMAPEAPCESVEAVGRAGPCPAGSAVLGLLHRGLFVVLWGVCVAFLCWAPLAQQSAGLSRFVLLAGVASLWLAWPSERANNVVWRDFLSLVPVLALAMALDLQAGLPVERVLGLVGRGLAVCLGATCLGASPGLRRRAPYGVLFLCWFLLPLALGVLGRVAAGAPFEAAQALSWSPVGALWLSLPLQMAGMGHWVSPVLCLVVGLMGLQFRRVSALDSGDVGA